MKPEKPAVSRHLQERKLADRLLDKLTRYLKAAFARAAPEESLAPGIRVEQKVSADGEFDEASNRIQVRALVEITIWKDRDFSNRSFADDIRAFLADESFWADTFHDDEFLRHDSKLTGLPDSPPRPHGLRSN